MNFTGNNTRPPWQRTLLAGGHGARLLELAVDTNCVVANFGQSLEGVSDKVVPYVDVASSAEFGELFKQFVSGSLGVDTLVINTVEAFQRILMAERLAAQGRPEPEPSDYGWLTQRCHQIFEKLKVLPGHLIGVTHLKDIQDGAGNVFFKPALAGAFANELHEYFSQSLLVLAAQDAEGEAVWSVRSRPSASLDWVKDESKGLPAVIPLSFDGGDMKRLRGAVLPKVDAVPPPTEVPSEAPQVTPAAPVESEVRETTEKATKVITDDSVASQEDSVSAPSSEKAPEDAVKCSDCSNPVVGEGRLDMAMLRYKTPLCADCFTARRGLS